MEGWRQGDHSADKKLSNEEQEQIHLTPTGLLMEGDSASVLFLFALEARKSGDFEC